MLFAVDEREDLWIDGLSMQLFRGSRRGPDQMPEPITQEELGWYDVPPDFRPTIIYLSALHCNLRCRYCYADEGTYRTLGDQQMTFDGYVDSFRRISEAYRGVKAISFFGGEPLLNYPQIRLFVEYLEEQGVHPTLAINSNGTLMRPDIIDFLLRHGIAVGTSVDGPEKLHDDNRITKSGNGTHRVLARHIRAMKDAGVAVFAQWTLSKTHIDAYRPGAVIEWLREMEALGLDNYDVIPVSTTDPRYRIDVDGADGAAYRAILHEMCDYYLAKMAAADVDDIPRMFVSHFLRIITRTRKRECTAGHSVSVTPDGHVFPCHTFSTMPDFGVPVASLPQSHPFENPLFAEAALAKRVEIDACQACLARSLCSVWCKGLALSLTGEMRSVLDERCVMMKILTQRLARFLVEDYPANRVEISKALVAFNKRQLALSGQS